MEYSKIGDVLQSIGVGLQNTFPHDPIVKAAGETLNAVGKAASGVGSAANAGDDPLTAEVLKIAGEMWASDDQHTTFNHGLTAR